MYSGFYIIAQAGTALHCNLEASTVSCPGASPINGRQIKKKGTQSAPEALKRPRYEWNSAD